MFSSHGLLPLVIIRYDSTQCKTSVEAFKYLNDKQNSKEIRMAGFKRLTDAVTQLCHFVDEKDAREAILAIRKHTRIWSPSRTPYFAGKHLCREVVAMYFDKNSIEDQAFYF